MAADSKYGRLFTKDDVLRILRYGANLDWSEILEEFDGPGGRGLTFPADEPLFLLRGQDKAAPEAIDSYGHECEAQGAPDDHWRAVQRAAASFERWQAEHPDRVKVPD